MQIPIFWRLILGTLGILLLSIAACLYSIIQLGTLSRTAREALDGDHRMIGYQQALTDAFLSEVRYGGKYIITHAEDRYEQLRQFKNDFARFLGELKSLVHSEEVANSLSRVDQLHRQYHELFDREAAYIRAKQTYAQSRYQQERDKVFESALSELERLKAQLQADLQEKLEGIDHAARMARQIAIITTLIVALLGILFSLKISRSIAAPLKQQLRIEAEPHGNNESRSSASEVLEIDEPASASEYKEDRFDNRLKPVWLRLNTLASGTLVSLSRRLALSKGFTTRKGD
jgi:CHASE3 domain sensor protein